LAITLMRETLIQDDRKHVLRDLEPYVCTFRDCEQGDRLFENRDEWYEHEIQQHRMEYTCNTEGHESSDDRNAFSTHMQSLHGAEMDSPVNPAVFDMFLHPSRKQSGTCALCGALAMKLKKHLSHHLERIALFALPRNQDFGDFDDSQLEKSDVSLKLLDGSAGAKSNAQAQVDDSHVSPSEASLSAAEDVEIASLDTTENLYDLDLLKRTAETPMVEETVPDTAPFSWDFATDKFKDARSDPEPVIPRALNESQPDEAPPIVDFIEWFNSNRTNGILSSSPDVKHPFMPLPMLTDHLRTPYKLDRILKALFQAREPSVTAEEIWQKGMIRILAILILIGKGRHIERCAYYSNLRDINLPFVEQPAHFPPSTDETNSIWEAFHKKQWQLCAHEFTYQTMTHLEEHTILPIIERTKLAEGGSATVHKIKLHAAYDKLVSRYSPNQV
jgi:hypothetical protein